MKMSRVSDKNKEVLEEKEEVSESDISEEDEDEEDETESPETEEASQLYRNSSLGLYVIYGCLRNFHSLIFIPLFFHRFGGVSNESSFLEC